MPYQRLLDELVAAVPGARAALLLDSEGEVVVEAGARGESQRLIGAYQGIALAALRRTAARLEAGGLDYMLSRYSAGQVLLRPLKDGYYVMLAMEASAPAALGVYRSAATRVLLDAEL